MSNLVVLQITGGSRGAEKPIMPNLTGLEIRVSNMTTTPDVSCCLKLEIVTFESFSNLKEIHHSIGKLESLTSLTISWCRSLRSLPNELCCASALRELTVIESMIEEVPASIGRLQSLRTLNIWRNKIKRLPASICDLKNLLVLDAEGNPLDEGIPEEIGSLSALEYLALSGSRIRFLPSTISQISSLKSLKLRDCDLLQELPRLPSSLTKLIFSSKTLRAVPNLAAQTNMTELMLSDGRYRPKDYEGERLELSGLGSLEKLKSLELRLSRMNTFSRASELGSLSRLETLHLSFPDMASVSQLPSSLRKLILQHSQTGIPWERYSNLMLLTELVLINLTVTDIELGGLDSLPSFTTLSIENSKSLLRVSNLGRLRGLKSLTFRSCKALVEIPGLEQLELLEGLSIWKCGSIRGIPDLLALERLKDVEILGCTSWQRVPRLIRECRLHIWGHGMLRSFDGTYGEYEGRYLFV